MTAVLHLNPKWKRTDVHDALASRWSMRRVSFNDQMTLLDFQLNNNGFTYIQKSSTHSLSDYRKHLVKLHNKHPDLVLQALVDYTETSLFNAIQEFATVELKIQVVPIESVTELAQYLDRCMMIDSKEDKNPFLKDLNLTKASDLLVNCIRMIPKIGEKNARTLAVVFQNLKNLSSASHDELKDVIGAAGAKAVLDYFKEKN